MANIGIKDGVISSSAQVEVQVPELRVIGDLIAENYIISSSVTSLTYQSLSGSTIFGDSPDDTHQFTGSLFITGSEINLQGPGTPTLFVRNSAGSQNSTIHIGEVNTTAYGAEFKYEGNLGNLFIDNRYNHSTRPHIYFRMRVAGTPITAMTIDPAGQVGIGTTSPDSNLHIFST